MNFYILTSPDPIGIIWANGSTIASAHARLREEREYEWTEDEIENVIAYETTAAMALKVMRNCPESFTAIGGVAMTDDEIEVGEPIKLSAHDRILLAAELAKLER